MYGRTGWWRAYLAECRLRRDLMACPLSAETRAATWANVCKGMDDARLEGANRLLPAKGVG